MPYCPGAKLSGAKLYIFIILVPNCPLLLSWCQIVRFFSLGAKLSALLSWYQIVKLSYNSDGDGCVRGGDGDDGGDDDDHVDGGDGDPLHRPLSVLGGDVRVDALVAKVRDDRPQECLRLLHVVERW